MSNPVLVEALRGPLIESSHRGAVAVLDADGHTVLKLGDVTEKLYPRSAVKPFQALPLIEFGAADRYGLNEEELAIACASHSGEPGHTLTVARILQRAGLDASALQCGAHWPLHEPSGHAMAQSGNTPTALHNNCSGKHAGFLCVACTMGIDHKDYINAEHAVQREVKTVIENLTGAALSDQHCAVDGCSVPTWALSLSNLALGFARFGTGHRLGPERAKAAARLRVACAAKPWHFAGTDRFCTEIMKHFDHSVFVKVGAEGVYGMALPEAGLGVAIKCDDGAWRAASVITTALLVRLLKLDIGQYPTIQTFLQPTIRNWNGVSVGQLTPSQKLTAAEIDPTVCH